MLLLSALITYAGVQAQEDTASVVSPIGNKYLEQVNAKANQLEQKLDRQSEKIITQFLKQENKLKRKLARQDSATATAVLGDAKQRYDRICFTLMKVMVL